MNRTTAKLRMRFGAIVPLNPIAYFRLGPHPVEVITSLASFPVLTSFPVSRWECPPETLAQARQRSRSLLEGYPARVWAPGEDVKYRCPEINTKLAIN
ncbi:MAG: hypothetical protein AAGD25_36430 [Cyanobacteria bacterium P01_F01_bin.150]